jgi:hypothetical protein
MTMLHMCAARGFLPMSPTGINLLAFPGAGAASEGLRDAIFIRNSQGCQTQWGAHGGKMRDTDRSFPKAYSVALPA